MSTTKAPYFENEMNRISNEDLLKLDTWIANNVPNKNFERLFTIWVHLTAEYSRLIKQRDAALKLADEILIHRVSPLLRDSEWVMGRMDGKRDVANKIRAIFEPKEEK